VHPLTDERDEWTENRAQGPGSALRLGELWAYRELVAFLALRDLKVRYKQAVFGAAWAIVQPLAGAITFTIVFRRLVGVPSDGLPYLPFAFCGFVVWSFLAAAVNGARGSLVGNSSLITKVYFPRIAAPVAAVLPSLVDLAVAFVLLFGFMVWYRIVPGFQILLTPLFLAAAVLVALGTGTLFATLSVEYRDVHQVFGLLVQLWFFASPVAYPSSLIPGAWQWLYAANPMVTVIDGVRWCLLDAPPPGPEALVSLVTGAVILAVGLKVFHRTERRFADVI
jgi:lipopolysaccharide transport system permease protein